MERKDTPKCFPEQRGRHEEARRQGGKEAGRQRGREARKQRKWRRHRNERQNSDPEIEIHLRLEIGKCFDFGHLAIRDCACHLRSKKQVASDPPPPTAEGCGEAGEWRVARKGNNDCLESRPIASGKTLKRAKDEICKMRICVD